MKYILPKKIIYNSGDVKREENLFIAKPLQIGLNEPLTASVKGKASIIFDFGEELSGGVRLLTYSAKGNRRVRIRFGESVSETLAEIGEKNATNDHSNRDFTAELQNYSDMTFGQTGFRFVKIDFLGGEFEIKSVTAASDCIDRETTGSFRSSDELLNRIWATAARTLKLCVKNGYIWDGIKRDRLVWIGDLYPEIKSAYCLFKGLPEVKNSLEFCRDQTPDGEWMNTIPAYSAWWLINLCEYYLKSGDDAFVKENAGFITRLINRISECVSDSGDVIFPHYFIDWPTHPQGKDGDEFDEPLAKGDEAEKENEIKDYDEKAGTNYLIKIAFARILPLLKNFGIPHEQAEKTLEKLNKKRYTVKRYKQIAALAVFSGDKNERTEQIMLDGGANGLTTFLNYLIFSALALCGKQAETIDMIKEYYGKMLDLGATTFWEDFDVDWAKNAFKIDEMPVKGRTDPHGDRGKFCYKGFRHSLCHGWASGVLCYMTEELLGVKQTSFNEFTIAPHLCGLEKISGVYPTKFGEIKVEAATLPNGKVKTTVTAPDGIIVKTDGVIIKNV